MARPWRLAVSARVALACGTVLLVAGVLMAAWVLLAPPSADVAAHRAPGPGSPEPGAAVSGDGGQGLTATPRASAGAGAAGGPSDPLAGAGVVVVHVTGAVERPGVVRLPVGARVEQAIEAGGGALPEADLDQLNLARLLVDGEQVRVPRHGETVAQPEASASQAGGASASTHSSGSGAGPGGAGARVNLNEADAATLEQLTGIGPALARRIVQWRAEHGPFASVEELTDVPGIGTATLSALRDEVTV